MIMNPEPLKNQYPPPLPKWAREDERQRRMVERGLQLYPRDFEPTAHPQIEQARRETAETQLFWGKKQPRRTIVWPDKMQTYMLALIAVLLVMVAYLLILSFHQRSTIRSLTEKSQALETSSSSVTHPYVSLRATTPLRSSKTMPTTVPSPPIFSETPHGIAGTVTTPKETSPKSTSTTIGSETTSEASEPSIDEAEEPRSETTTTTTPSTTSETTTTLSTTSDWWDAGNGVLLPPIFEKIRRCESNHNYQAVNPTSGAAGAWQFLDSTWADAWSGGGVSHAERFGVSSARHATPEQQDQAVLITYEVRGTQPWSVDPNSHDCWG